MGPVYTYANNRVCFTSETCLTMELIFLNSGQDYFLKEYPLEKIDIQAQVNLTYQKHENNMY